MKVDLSKCKPGDRLKMRNGEVIAFDRVAENEAYPKHIYATQFYGGVGRTYTRDGMYYDDCEDSWDIIAILSRRKPRRSLAEVIYMAMNKDGWAGELVVPEEYHRAARAVAREVRRRAAK